MLTTAVRTAWIERRQSRSANPPPRQHAAGRAGLWLSAILLAMGAGLTAPALHAAEALPGQMPLEPGDVVAVTVEQAPEIGREARVDVTGRVMLPMIGAVPVAGLDPDAAGKAIAKVLADRDIVLSPTVTVEVATYRQFYVDGSVANPGAFDFQPGLTVRRALVLAGGVDAGQAEELTVADLVEMNSTWRMAAYDLMEVNSRIARLQAELNRSPDITPPNDATGVVPPERRAAIQAADSAILKDQLADMHASEDHLKDLSSLVDFELGVLAEQTRRREEENAMQNVELETSRALVEKGLMSQPKLRELERERSRLSRDLLDVQAYTARAQQNKATLTYELGSSDRKWRISVQADLRKAMLERTGIEAKLDVLRSSLVAAGLKLNASGETTRSDPRIAIFRVIDNADQRLPADMNSPVLPGDVVEVSFEQAPQG